ncbi:oligosaccharide flippase family protein [Halolamina salifodinae]|uniref:O-antigen/teichoic acid export membrane protein n=1 Tax=Halolamina salifodinae TaxID=1202767 RepID=A0A8T4GXV2_9EURY|nr:oligosaccharide flippase family protein [Halolamina salifodinae]MBP1987796.1 O-antigen/teichoic acid export membrane protein [Halolamina salifodinae]
MGESRGSKIKDVFQRFSQDFGLYSIAEFVPALLGVAALMIFTRIFPPVAYGQYALAMTFVAVFSTLTFGWLEQAILRFEPQIDTEELVGNVVSILVGCCLIIAVLVTAGYVLFGGALGEYRAFYLAAGALTIAQGLFNTFRSLFQARLQPGSVATYKILRSVAKLAFAFVLAVIVFDDIVGWLWGGAFATTITVAVMAYRSNVMRFSPRIQSALGARFLRYGFPMIGWLLGLTLLNFADRVLIEFIQGSSAVGVYSSNYSLVNRGLLLVFTPLIQTIHPILMNRWDGENVSEVEGLMTDFTRYFLIIGVAATIFAGVVSRPLSTILLAPEYRDGYVLIPIVAAGLFLWNISMIGHKGLEIQERTRLMFFGVSGAVVLNVALNVPLIRLYGYLGAAVATLVSFGAYAVFAYVSSLWSIQWRFPLRTVRNTAIGGVVMIAPGAILYTSSAYTALRAIVVAGVGVVMYGAILYALGELESNELTAAAELVRRN